MTDGRRRDECTDKYKYKELIWIYSALPENKLLEKMAVA